MYLEKAADNYLRAAVDTTVAIHKHEKAGDVLVFLPGMEDIEKACSQIKVWFSSRVMQPASALLCLFLVVRCSRL